MEMAPMTALCRLLGASALLAVLMFTSGAGDAILRPDGQATEASLAGRLLVGVFR